MGLKFSRLKRKPSKSFKTLRRKPLTNRPDCDIIQSERDKEEIKMLNTVEFGWVRIVDFVDCRFAVCLGWDLVGEWKFFQLPDGEIVALEDLE